MSPLGWQHINLTGDYVWRQDPRVEREIQAFSSVHLALAYFIFRFVRRPQVGYVPLAEVGAEFLFQVIAERAEKTAVIVTTNIIETGTESYRFRRTLEKRKAKAPDTNS